MCRAFGAQPQLRPLATPRRAGSRLRPPSAKVPSSPTSFSRFLGLRGWVDRLAAEPPAVVLHAGFGIQLLSMPVGESGVGLSQGLSLQPLIYCSVSLNAPYVNVVHWQVVFLPKRRRRMVCHSQWREGLCVCAAPLVRGLADDGIVSKMIFVLRTE